MASQLDFCTLPEDIVYGIISFIYPLDIIHLRQTCKQMYDFTSLRTLWTSFYKDSSLFLPPGPFPSQSISDLEHVLVHAQRLDENWHSSDAPEFKTTRELKLDKPFFTAQLLRGRYLFLGLGNSFSLYDLDRGASWNEPIYQMTADDDVELEFPRPRADSTQWYLNGEVGSPMYVVVLARKRSQMGIESESQNILVWKVETFARAIMTQVASIPFESFTVSNVTISETFVVCHVAALTFPYSHLQDSIVYHIPTGNVYHFLARTVQMATFYTRFDRLILAHQESRMFHVEVFTLPKDNDADTSLLQRTHHSILDLPGGEWIFLDNDISFTDNQKLPFIALKWLTQGTEMNIKPAIYEMSFHNDGTITSSIVTEGQYRSVFKLCANASNRRRTTLVRAVSFAFERDTPLEFSDIELTRSDNNDMSLVNWRDRQTLLNSEGPYPFDYTFDGYAGRVCLSYAGRGVVIGDFV